MPFYDARAIYADPILTDLSLGFTFDEGQLVGNQLYPFTSVPLPSGRYRVFDRSDWVTFPSRREPGTVANEVRGRKWSEDTFSVKEHMLQAAVDDEERQNYNASLQNAQANLFAGIEPERDAVNLITRSLLLEYELAVSALATNTATYPSGHSVTLSGSSQWNDSAGTSKPLENIITGMNAIYSDILEFPNLMIFSYDAWISLANHPELQARWQYVAPQNAVKAQVDQQIRLFTGFDGQILVTNVQFNTADNIDATQSLSKMWGKNVILAKVDTGNQQMTQTFGKTFVQPYPGGNVRQAWRWREENRTSDVFRVGWRWDLKTPQPLAGYLIKNAVA